MTRQSKCGLTAVPFLASNIFYLRLVKYKNVGLTYRCEDPIFCFSPVNVTLQLRLG